MGGAICLYSFLSLTIFIAMVVISYTVYLCVACCCSDIKGYIENMKKFDSYQETYDNMVKGQGYFTFWIECYHYVTVYHGKGRTSRRKVVTHTATSDFTFAQSVDESGELVSI